MIDIYSNRDTIFYCSNILLKRCHDLLFQLELRALKNPALTL